MIAEARAEDSVQKGPGGATRTEGTKKPDSQGRTK